MPSIRRPLTLLTSLLVAAIAIASHFYVPKYPSDHITTFVQQHIHEQAICQGMVDATEDAKVFVRISSCRSPDGEVPLKGRAQITFGSAGTKFVYGDIVIFRTHLREPTDFNNPGGFKYKRYCLAHGIDVLGYIDDPAWMTKVGVAGGHAVRRTIERWRHKIALVVEHISDPKIKGPALALTIGDGSLIEEGTKEDFRLSGLAHILVISGLNVAFIAVAAFFIFKWLLLRLPGFALRFNIFKPVAALTIGFVWLYAFITGAEVSVIRAAIISTVYLAGIALDKRQDIFTSLSVAALIILAISPLAIFDISFQLSFVAVLSIAIIYPRLNSLFNVSKYLKVVKYLLETVLASVAATIGVAPLLSYYFHTSSFIGVLANIFAVPYSGFILTPFGMGLSLIAMISTTLGGYLALFFGHLIRPLVFIAHAFAGISGPATFAFSMPFISLIAFYLIAALVLVGRRWRYSRAGIVVLVAVFIAGVAYQHEWLDRGSLRVTFLDVGQGSSTVVRFPNGKVLVVDGGGSKNSEFDIGRSVVAPYLWYKGITKIDEILLTHPHPDHFKGLAFLAEEFHPDSILYEDTAPEEGDAEEWNVFLERIKKAGVGFKPPASNPDRDLEVLDLNGTKSEHSVNSSSTVIKVSYGNISFLLTGDIGSDAESDLVREYGDSLSSTVLQVPHHGSRTSSSDIFLNIVRPKFAVIQLGMNNSYGFPNKEVVQRLERSGTEMLRTDLNGAVEFKTDGHYLIRR